MIWKIEYDKEVENDLKNLDPHQRNVVFKATRKVAINPLPNSEGGYGKPLGNRDHTDLTGCLKIKLQKLGLRVVCQVIREGSVMYIIVISVREDAYVYKLAYKRIHSK